MELYYFILCILLFLGSLIYLLVVYKLIKFFYIFERKYFNGRKKVYFVDKYNNVIFL